MKMNIDKFIEYAGYACGAIIGFIIFLAITAMFIYSPKEFVLLAFDCNIQFSYTN